MKFLADQAISWRVARDLRNAGYDAIHVRDLELSSASDQTVLQRAVDESRVIITQDTDFGTLLTSSNAIRPSVILLRLRDGRPETQARLLLDNLKAVHEDLSQGAIVVLTDSGLRVRKLPS